MFGPAFCRPSGADSPGSGYRWGRRGVDPGQAVTLSFRPRRGPAAGWPLSAALAGCLVLCLVPPRSTGGTGVTRAGSGDSSEEPARRLQDILRGPRSCDLARILELAEQGDLPPDEDLTRALEVVLAKDGRSAGLLEQQALGVRRDLRPWLVRATRRALGSRVLGLWHRWSQLQLAL